MIFWLDAHISPKLIHWIQDIFGLDVLHVRDLGLRDAEDAEIFYKAREAKAVVITKDRDFVDLLGRLGAPPKVIWITCGKHFKCSLENDFLKDSFRRTRVGKSRGEFG